METRIVKNKINIKEIKALAHKQYQDIIKAVVDVRQEIMGIGGELHIDIQSILVEKESSRGNETWGINLYLDKTGDDFIEFDSMINLKPNFGNRSRDIENEEVKDKIREIVNKLIEN